MAVSLTIAAARGGGHGRLPTRRASFSEPTKLEPLYISVDTDALDALFDSDGHHSSDGVATVSVEFAGQEYHRPNPISSHRPGRLGVSRGEYWRQGLGSDTSSGSESSTVSTCSSGRYRTVPFL
ncbi:HalOD1 output domain-containing protein [Haloarchaeobius salinus]|uniref:HalOD1 output domain-containing protein n=1 Tax=Haloarchaeobius salinus TaxID=1198298 RepID=UPI0034A4E5BC